MLKNRYFLLLLQLISGAATVLAFAPVSQVWLLPLALWTLFWSWHSATSLRDILLPSFAWGLGYFCANTGWVYISLHTHGGMPIPMAAGAVFLLASFLALFPMLAAWLTWRLPCSKRWRIAVAAPTLFILSEWVRGWIFTGFPWASVGSAQIDWLGGLYPIVGTYGAGWLLALCVATSLVEKRIALGLAIALFSSSALLGKVAWTLPVGKPLAVSILQGNIEQDMKWNPEFYLDSLSTYLKLIQDAKGQLIIMPETALPSFLADVPSWYLDELRAIAQSKNAEVLLGVATEGPASGEYHNSVINLHNVELRYSKSHLVPFGEYVPLPWLFAGVYQYLNMPLNGFQRAPLQQAPFAIAGGFVAANICYEDVFGDEIRVNGANATLLANFTNMAWFDGSWAAEQHAQMARARALENGRYLIRATNTGKTAIIDPKGRIIAALPEQKTAILEGEIRHMQGNTPYQWAGDRPVIGFLFLLLAAGYGRHRKKDRVQK